MSLWAELSVSCKQLKVTAVQGDLVISAALDGDKSVAGHEQIPTKLSVNIKIPCSA